MSIKPRDFLTQSRELIKSDEEVDHRTAISRAYYCALHSCISLCEAFPDGFNDDTSSSHESVIRNLKRCPNEKPYKQFRHEILGLADQLQKGKNRRKKADYMLLSTINKNHAAEHIDKMGLLSVRAAHITNILNAATAAKTA